jgi:uncharacterized protein
MRYGLADNTINDVVVLIASCPNVEEVVLFGSRAKGNFKRGSDIDLAILGSEVTLATINDISTKIDELYLPYTFDFIIHNHVDSDDLLAHIHRVGISLYKR